jgi:homoserine dehydrogenase
MERTTGVAIVGCGTVGSAVAARLLSERAYYLRKTGASIDLRHIVGRSFAKARAAGLPERLFTTDLASVLADDAVSVIVELIGGTDAALRVTRQAIEAGRHVVTETKALLAHHGTELLAMARKRGVTVSFEASCAGGIPIIRILQDGLLANRIEALYGIVNGTCNYILTEMIASGKSYATALSDAQEKGFAEADPHLDVAGIDSAHKLAILGSLAFGTPIDFTSLPVQGIDTLDSMDVSFGRELGYIVKLLAVARRTDHGISCRVRPAFISTSHPLAWVSGPFNAVSVYGDLVGHTMYYGRGAGGSPTASSVIADIISTALGTTESLFANLTIWPDTSAQIPLLPLEEIESRYYLRVMVEDKPGVFAALASVLGNHGISISSALQKEPASGNGSPSAVPIVITTHRVREGFLRNAILELNGLPCVQENCVFIDIIEEQEETI